MKEIREIFDTVRTYCGMIFGENRAAKFVKGVRTIRRKDNKSETEKVVLVDSSKEQKSIEDLAYLPNKTANLLVTDAMQGFSLLGRELERGVEDKYRKNSPLSRISNAHRSSQRTATSSLGEVSSTTQQQPLSVVIPSDSEGIQPIKIERLVAYPSKSSLTREDLCYGKVTHDNNFDSPETVYSLLTTHHSLKRAAFTLAEVLITLGIIGVVAALTLPTLIQNHQKQVCVTQLKKAYSNISNAYNQIANDEGVTEWSQTCFTDWTGNNNCLHKLAKQMKAINTKDFGVTCSADWCSAALSANTSSTFYETDGMLVTSDGMVYIFACGTLLSTIIVDVNGVKGPNKAGRDVFEFKQKATSGYDANGHWVVSYYNSLEPIGTDSDEWKNCSATNLSTDCTAKVLIEGKMNY